MNAALVTGVTPDMTLFRELTFGPVLAIMKVEQAEEAVPLANNSPDGLAASVWSKDVVKAERLTSLLEVGLVGINELATHYAYGSLPFGGLKSSGLWRRHGDEGLLALTQAQSIITHDWPTHSPDLWWYPKNPRLVSFLRWIAGLR
jgi:acyl-CoA reductase-like NAD-dependent aldehyde dehydrogenase